MFIVFAGSFSNNPPGADNSHGVFKSTKKAKAFCEQALVQEYECVEIAKVVDNSLVARWRWKQYGTGGNSGWIEVES